MKRSFLAISIIILLQYSCTDKSANMKHTLTRISSITSLKSDWDVSPWNSIDPTTLSNYMGERPEHFPNTQVKLAYDHEAIYVKFRVEDQYVKAVYNKNQDPVYKDSCVEFFFTPGTDVSRGYFNLEMNCGGTMLFHHQVEPRKDAVEIAEEDIQQIQVVASMPDLVDPEIAEKTTWKVAYKIPFSILKKYHDFSDPDTGTIWLVNFYKCADETSRPHWLTWAPINRPSPDFHRPEYFGQLEF